MSRHPSLAFASALSVAALAALALGLSPRSAPQGHEPSVCDLHPPIEFAVDESQIALLTSSAVGRIELKIGAQSSQADVKVTVYLSPGLELVSGETAFLDAGDGELLVVEKLDDAPQWIQLVGVATRDDGETFARHQLYGEQPSPIWPGGQIVDGAVTYPMQWE